MTGPPASQLAAKPSAEPTAQSVSTIVSIGMAVYNGEHCIRAALDALLVQTYPHFELTISDNASTDATEKICREYAAKDARIRYIRQSANMGATANFRFVLLQAAREYFMWASADDVRSPDYLAVNIAFLASHPDYVASTSPTRFVGGEFNPVKMGDESLDDGNAFERIIRPFSSWHANGRFYSLFRRELVTSWPHLSDLEFLGSDWTLINHLALLGKFQRNTAGWVELGNKGISNSKDIFALYRKRKLHWLLPFHSVNIDTLRHVRGATLLQKARLLLKLMRLNRKAARKQFRAWRKSNKTARSA